MIESMTGYGRGTAQLDGTVVTVEMRSVNSRFCEVSVRLPRVLSEYEAQIQSIVRQALSRGRINVQVQLEQTEEELLPIRINEEAVKAYSHLLEQLRQAAGIQEPVRIEHLMTFSEVFTNSEEVRSAAEQAWEACQQALEQAIENLRQMRHQEGKTLQADLLARIDAIQIQLRGVEKRAPERVVEARERLKTRLQELLDDERINPDRLELEIAIMADKLDVTEECVRLNSHLDVFRQAFESGEPVGRKLNFLVQEINREVNTIGSKSNDAEVAHLAVQMKEELERIREQVQNIE